MSIQSDLKRFAALISYKLTGTDRHLKRWHHAVNRLKKYPAGNLRSLISAEELQKGAYDRAVMSHLNSMYLSHRYDLLGSGWVCVNYQSRAVGVGGYHYHSENDNLRAQREKLKQKISKKEFDQLSRVNSHITDGYRHIFWNRDFKCGYVWETDVSDSHSCICTPQGVDIKTVWELGRLQFLPQLAVGALFEEDRRTAYLTEYKNVILDFISQNPVHMGVQWTSPMDAAIRAVNILIAWDIFHQLDETGILDPDFHGILYRSIYDHGRFIFDHLEKDVIHKKNGNHYYSNIVGLIYISSYLSESRESRRWYRYAKTEFIDETKAQFFDDGGNIEASTCYHCLMLEMLAYGCAALARRGERIPDFMAERLVRGTYLAQMVTKSDGRILQMGDNDSGRFVKLVSYGEFLENQTAEDKYLNLKGYTELYGKNGRYFDEDPLNRQSVLKYTAGIVECGMWTEPELKESLEALLIKTISKSALHADWDFTYCQKPMKEKNEETGDGGAGDDTAGSCRVKTVYAIPHRSGENLWGYFPDFGVYYIKNRRMELYVYSGGSRGRQRQGHSHNDTMHCELTVDGKDILCDRGTYLYTALSADRDLFRSCKAHFVPDYGFEYREFDGPFQYRGKEQSLVTEISNEGITIRYWTDKIQHIRKIRLEDNHLIIHDQGNLPFAIERPAVYYYSAGYGKVEKSV